MSDDRQSDSVLRELADELKLQAWLARRERAEPSLEPHGVHEEASALAMMRDTLRVQLHLGQLEAKDEWARLENKWRHFMRDEVPNTAAEALKEIREGYHELLDR